MKTFKLEITLKVADCWIEDGFGPHSKQDIARFNEQIEEALRYQLLTSATSSEFKVSVKLIDHPDFKSVSELQGYSSTVKK